MMTIDLDKALLTAIGAVRRASVVCRAVQERLVDEHAIEKRDRSPVTVADFASQAVVCAALTDQFPDIPIVGEEDSAALRDESMASLRDAVVEHVGAEEQQVLAWIDRGAHDGSADRYWALDPIDGTKGFLRREQYAVALALIDRGRVVMGALACPQMDEAGVIAAAITGTGARAMTLDGDWATAKPIKVTAAAATADARFCESVESAHSDQSASALLARALGITQAPLRMDSQAKYVAVARGDSDIYLRLPTRTDYRENIWDHAAGAILIEEAGGRVTDIDGNPLDYAHGRRFEQNRGIVGTNGLIHDQVIDAIRQLG